MCRFWYVLGEWKTKMVSRSNPTELVDSSMVPPWHDGWIRIDCVLQPADSSCLTCRYNSMKFQAIPKQLNCDIRGSVTVEQTHQETKESTVFGDNKFSLWAQEIIQTPNVAYAIWTKLQTPVVRCSFLIGPPTQCWWSPRKRWLVS